MADSKRESCVGDLTVKIDVDVSEAITGLKAIQRMSRETSKELRELEEHARRMGDTTKEAMSNE